MNPIANELGKIAVQKLSEITADDARAALKTITKVTAGGALAGPTLGVLGAGVLIGVGIGVLFAPGSGRETRARLKDAARSGWSRLTGNGARPTVVTVSAVDDVTVN